MTKHDISVLTISRKILTESPAEVKVDLRIGRRVVARQKIITKLRAEFPEHRIRLGGHVDIET